jgi:type VI protein secretion system component VasF
MAKSKGNDSSWGGGGDDFWGSSPTPSDTPPSAAPASRPATELQAPPGKKITLLEAIEPIFLFICQQHRVAKEGRALSFDNVRNEVNRLMGNIEDRARRDPLLQQQFERIRDPLCWYVDYWFGSSGEFPTLRDPWNSNRLGEYPDDEDGGSLAGDEAFYDKLEEALKADSADEAANERLAFYYTAIGIGFTGLYFKAIPEHQQKLRDYMGRLYPRVRKFIDANPSSKVTPEAYNFTDKRDFIAPARDRPLILLAALLCLLLTIFMGYFYLYGVQKKGLKSAVQDIQRTESAAPAGD